MEIIGYVFGIFGFLAFCEVSSLQHRMKKLEKAFEEHFAGEKGSPSYEERMALFKVIRSYVGKKVTLEFQSEEYDFYELNAKISAGKGSCTILDADKDWVLVNLKYDKVDKDKLIRLKEISRIKGIEE